MITSLQLYSFKNFDKETLRVGPFTVIVGANASGKSNIRDAFRVLHGIGRGYTVAEIIGGKYGAGGQVEWEPIRGAPREIAISGQHVFGLRLELMVEGKDVTFSIIFRPELLGTSGFRIGREELAVDGEKYYVIKSGKLEVTPKNIYVDLEYTLRRDQTILTQMREITLDKDTKKYTGLVADALASMRFLDLVPDRMRLPSLPGQIVMGDGGENLPTVLQALCTDPEKKEVLTQWTRELTPMDVADFVFRDDPAGRVHLILKERSGREISAHSASDGT